jgi:hypothetical protein
MVPILDSHVSSPKEARDIYRPSLSRPRLCIKRNGGGSENVWGNEVGKIGASH